jgi:DNA-binding transcriptional regulator YiaG
MDNPKEKDAKYIRERMGALDIKPGELARALSVTTQTVRNLRYGNASDQLLRHAIIVIENWEQPK